MFQIILTEGLPVCRAYLVVASVEQQAATRTTKQETYKRRLSGVCCIYQPSSIITPIATTTIQT